MAKGNTREKVQNCHAPADATKTMLAMLTIADSMETETTPEEKEISKLLSLTSDSGMKTVLSKRLTEIQSGAAKPIDVALKEVAALKMDVSLVVRKGIRKQVGDTIYKYNQIAEKKAEEAKKKAAELAKNPATAGAPGAQSK